MGQKSKENISLKKSQYPDSFQDPTALFALQRGVFVPSDRFVPMKGPMKANRKPTKARELSVFSPPDKFEIFFQLFFGGLTLRIETVAIIKWN